ncbi:helix-turn-helix domain-containing protein [Aquabacter sp. CN5-332]|uniref:TetR/AcrR family transcriptional regulator n=1 Tax=Aquabacter sp. CN5-332 TaxID=3156608 RepID=UPI0032B57AD6
MTDCSDCSVGTSDDAKTRIDQIADAALRRFSRYGFKRSSMDDIAKEAGLAKATLYLHFKSKDDIFRAMIRRFGARVETRCHEVMAQKAPFREKLTALMDAHFGAGYAAFGAGEHLPELKAVITAIASREIEDHEGVFVALALRLLREGDAAGEISLKRVDPEPIVWTLIRAAIGAKMGTPPSPEIYAERLRQAVAVAAAAVDVA